MIMPKTTSIWFSHDVCFGKYTKRMRWPRSPRNSRRVACDRSTPRLPFFPQVLLDPAGPRHPLHQALRGVDVEVVHHEHPRRPRVRGHRLGHVPDEVRFGAARTQGRREQLAGDYMEVTDQGGGAVPLVLELPALGL